MYYLWLILLVLYILSPRDLYPGLIDDLIALGALFYIRYKNARSKRRGGYTSGRSRSAGGGGGGEGNELTLSEAYRLLGVSSGASWEEARKAYREKITKSHPDKVSHMSEELQEKAKELTLKLNNALDLIKRHRKI